MIGACSGKSKEDAVVGVVVVVVISQFFFHFSSSFQALRELWHQAPPKEDMLPFLREKKVINATADW